MSGPANGSVWHTIPGKVIAALIVASVVGSVAAWGEFKGFRTTLDAVAKDISDLEKLMNAEVTSNRNRIIRLEQANDRAIFPGGQPK